MYAVTKQCHKFFGRKEHHDNMTIKKKKQLGHGDFKWGILVMEDHKRVLSQDWVRKKSGMEQKKFWLKTPVFIKYFVV